MMRTATASYILLVEDNPNDVMLTRRAFKKNQFLNQIVVASDGEQALDLLLGSREAELPAFVLLDVKLPKVDGMEVLRLLRASPRTRRLPVVILTSSSEEPDRIRGYDLGVNSYVHKPVEFTEFVSLVGHLGDYWLDVNLGPP
jgi:two-component system response regulator